MHDLGFCHFGDFFSVLSDLPFFCWGHEIPRTGIDLVGLHYNVNLTHHFSDDDLAAGDHHFEPRSEGPYRVAPQDRALDLADLDVRFGDRSFGLSDALSLVSGGESVVSGQYSVISIQSPSGLWSIVSGMTVWLPAIEY